MFEGAAEVDEAQAPAPEDEARYDRVQRLVRDAVAIYRARGYGGTITVSQKVGIFTEACTLRVEPPASAPWTSPCDDKAAATTAANPESRDAKAGRVFQTLFARLERRAQAWQKLSGVEGLDPLLQASITYTSRSSQARADTLSRCCGRSLRRSALSIPVIGVG